MMTRSTALALAAGLAFALSVSGCAMLGIGQPREANACYWLSNVTNEWQDWPQAATRQDCFALDSCNGGRGESGGGCYKWAASADAPQNRW